MAVNDASLNRIGQIKGVAGTWAAGTTGLDTDRALFLKLGAAEVLDAYLRATVFKGTVRERNIRGGKSVAFGSSAEGARTRSPSARQLEPV